ncbi:TetR/AcrR family transcriptional regulator [Roseibium aggregatum]|uniref:TetR/AcrR family transcriptional regulator n=1 Tax=Roseibium aggregatum TaxID=187304 RepID=A0A939EDR7_9HYPH|nr:TetR/AcrR family transcriptional regulator [Roseibium aggregatum]MBN9670864.1 TetR/AcrR family transcriptional regulator [Roseibium aggregatum]
MNSNTPDMAAVAEAPAPTTDNAKRRQILDGARTVFRAKGFDGASMEVIAKEAGVSKGTLYVYFNSKEALFEALIQEERLGQPERMQEILISQSDIETDLKRIGRNYVMKMVRPEKISTLRMVIGAAEKFPQFGELVYESGPCRGRRELGAFIQERVTKGDLRPCDTELAAGQFFDLCVSGLLRRSLLNAGPQPNSGEVDQNVNEAVKIFLAAYGR